jgi:glycosyltransferase involved in cell wall biosynthesis
MAQADLLLLTSDYEGMPNVLLEALVLGTPVVSSDVKYGPREIIEQGAGGYVVPRDDIGSYSEAVVKILKDREGFSGRARENGAKFGIESHLPSYLRAMGLELEGKDPLKVVPQSLERPACAG